MSDVDPELLPAPIHEYEVRFYGGGWDDRVRKLPFLPPFLTLTSYGGFPATPPAPGKFRHDTRLFTTIFMLCYYVDSPEEDEPKCEYVVVESINVARQLTRGVRQSWECSDPLKFH